MMDLGKILDLWEEESRGESRDPQGNGRFWGEVVMRETGSQLRGKLDVLMRKQNCKMGRAKMGKEKQGPRRKWRYKVEGRGDRGCTMRGKEGKRNHMKALARQETKWDPRMGRKDMRGSRGKERPWQEKVMGVIGSP